MEYRDKERGVLIINITKENIMKEFKLGQEVWIRGVVNRSSPSCFGNTGITIDRKDHKNNEIWIAPDEVIPAPEFETGETVKVSNGKRIYLFSYRGNHYCVDFDDEDKFPACPFGFSVIPWNTVSKLPQKKEDVVLTVGGRIVDISKLSKESKAELFGGEL